MSVPTSSSKKLYFNSRDRSAIRLIEQTLCQVALMINFVSPDENGLVFGGSIPSTVLGESPVSAAISHLHLLLVHQFITVAKQAMSFGSEENFFNSPDQHEAYLSVMARAGMLAVIVQKPRILGYMRLGGQYKMVAPLWVSRIIHTINIDSFGNCQFGTFGLRMILEKTHCSKAVLVRLPNTLAMFKVKPLVVAGRPGKPPKLEKCKTLVFRDDKGVDEAIEQFINDPSGYDVQTLAPPKDDILRGSIEQLINSSKRTFGEVKLEEQLDINQGAHIDESVVEELGLDDLPSIKIYECVNPITLERTPRGFAVKRRKVCN